MERLRHGLCRPLPPLKTIKQADAEARVMLGSTGDLGPDVHLEAKVEGPNVTLTLSDGKKEFTATHTTEKYNAAGAVGLFHNRTAKQEFDNSVVSDRSGSKVLEEPFDRPDGPVEDWDLGDVASSNPERIAHLIDAVGWHPFYQRCVGGDELAGRAVDVATVIESLPEMRRKGPPEAT
ncbi:MAG: hypothetical protein ACC645_14960 [Pirellulales bacterium]